MQSQEFVKSKMRYNKVNQIRSIDSYEINSHSKSIPIYDTLIKPKTKLLTSPNDVPLQYQWLLNTSSRFDFHKHSSTLKIGPGSYNDTPNKKKSVYTFGKNKRFERVETQTGKIGPGNYDIQKAYLVKTRANRSFAKLSPIIHNQIKNITPGPGSYQNKSNNKKQSTSMEFKSKIDRFKVSQKSILGPGEYNQQGQFDKALKKIIVKRNPMLIKPIKSNHSSPKKLSQHKSPGPGQYQNSKTLTKYLKQKFTHGYKGDFGSKQNRFVQQKVTINTPGPGHYMKNHSQLSPISPSKPTSNFISSTKHSSIISQTPFGSYDLSSLNMSYSLQKKKQYIEHLKDINVDLPAFGSSAARDLQF